MHLAFPQKTLKPKAGGLSLLSRLQRNKKLVPIVIFLFTLYYLFSGDSSSLFFTIDQKRLPEAHGIYEEEILTSRTLIFPPVEHAPILKQLEVGLLFPYDKNTNKPLYDQTPSSDKKDKVDDQATLVREAFKNTGKLRFDWKNRKSPEVVVVTDVDFEKYDKDHLTAIVQNRVDYAQARHYGIYVRWTQEFHPTLAEENTDRSWAKLLCVRAAMQAFPKTRHFWYIGQDLVIVNYEFDIVSKLLAHDKLEPLLLKDKPVVPPSGAIHTYKNIKPENVKFLITQDDRGLNTNSFIVENDLFGKTLMEFWADPLYRKYNNFPMKESSALMHILQWHPVILSKTGLIPQRTIASVHNGDPEGGYQEGDLAVLLKDCDIRKTCEAEFDSYWKKLHK